MLDLTVLALCFFLASCTFVLFGVSSWRHRIRSAVFIAVNLLSIQPQNPRKKIFNLLPILFLVAAALSLLELKISSIEENLEQFTPELFGKTYITDFGENLSNAVIKGTPCTLENACDTGDYLNGHGFLEASPESASFFLEMI